MELIIAELITKFPIVSTILVVLGLIMVLAQVIVVLTPTKKDDEFLEKLEANSIAKKLIDLFVSFAPIQKSAKGLELSNKSLGK